jgi:photosystem II stability/assembly factor-like uncharacterized protein
LYNYNGTPWYSTPIQDHELTDLAYLGPNTIVAVGYGIIEKSNDKGQTWQPSAISGDFFRAVHFPTATTGYVVGYNGMIVKTTDGGDSWQIINSGGGGLIGKSYRMRDVFFVNASKGYIVGEGGVFWRTTDGGGNWYQVAGIPDNLNMQAITVYNGKGYITTSDGRILKFID